MRITIRTTIDTDFIWLMLAMYLNQTTKPTYKKFKKYTLINIETLGTLEESQFSTLSHEYLEENLINCKFYVHKWNLLNRETL